MKASEVIQRVTLFQWILTSEGSSLMPELMVRDLTFSTDYSEKTHISSSRVGKAVSGSVAEVGEDGEGELGALRFSVGVMEAAEVGGVEMAEGDGVVCSGCGFSSDGECVGCCADAGV